nr:hypothetical protein [Tanacetum cinerariifolium]
MEEHNNSQDDPYDFVYDGLSEEHRLLKEQPPCIKCGAKKIQYEFPTFCCMKGKITFQPLDIPPELYNLLTSQCKLGKMFRKNIRAYNTNFSFASMGVTLDIIYNANGSGVYTFRVQGGIYHRIDQLVPRDGEPSVLVWRVNQRNVIGIILGSSKKQRNDEMICTHCIDGETMAFSIKSVKYVFKYVYKGHDKLVVNVDKDREQVVNEIKRFQDARYVSPPKAMWRIYGFPLSNIYPSVMSLQVHLPNKQFVIFKEDVVLTDILERERNKRSMLTALFELNKTYTQDWQYLYKDIPKFYTWNKSTRKWNHQKQRKMRGRMVFTNPIEGECFYLRVLLQLVKGPTGFDYIYTVNDVLYTMFHRAALERGLIKSDDHIHACLHVCSYAFGCREVHEEFSIVVHEDDILARHSLNSDHKNEYDAIIRHVHADSPGVLFIDCPRGTGKTFLYKALLSTVRSCGLIALATASLGAAANNMTGRRTAHSHFKIPINLTTNLIYNIKKRSGLAKLLFQANINDMLIDRFPGEEKVYYSFDEAEDDTHNYYPLEFLNSLNVSGLPPHYLRLKIGCPIILLRNLDLANGLCNGMRLIRKRFDPNVINGEIAVGQYTRVRVLLPRISLAPSEEDMFLFKLKRTQFLVRLSFAMTINKAQGQTISNVGVYLLESVFSHG